MHAPRTEFLTHACENITFPQLLLRTVTFIHSQKQPMQIQQNKYFLAILYNSPAGTVNKFDHVPFVNPTQYRILINPQSVPWMQNFD